MWHFACLLVAGSLFAGFYFWVPKWTGRMCDETYPGGPIEELARPLRYSAFG